MGSTVTIYNNTRFILNIALSQVGPLYYENMVKPGEHMRRDVGKVWFTVEARLWDNGNNSYDDEQVIMPIVIMTVAAVTLAVGAFAALTTAGTSAAIVVTKLTAGVGVIGTSLGVSEKTRAIIKAMITGGAIKSLGWYMGSDRDICITGGPMGGYQWVNGSYFQAIDENTINWPFNVEAC